MNTLNGLTVIRARLVLPWQGVWFCDVELDQIPDTMPSGPVTLVLGGTTLKGSVDELAVGTWTSRAALRVLGGNGGWNDNVSAQQFYSSAGVTSTVVYSTTAKLVGETISDPTPQTWGNTFARTAGPASRVFGDGQWYVDPTSGTTFVANWPNNSLSTDAVIANFSPVENFVDIHSDAIVYPGTVLTDPRLNGVSYTIRDTEQIWDSQGSRVSASVSTNQTSRLAAAMQTLVREMSNVPYLRTYRYRFVLPDKTDYTTMAIQAITPGAPDLNPISQWTGLAGATSKIPPGLEIVVGFTCDQPSVPYIIAYSNMGTPSEIDLAGGSFFLVPAPWATGLATALAAMASSLASATTVANVAAAGLALESALAALPSPSTTILRGT